MIKTALEAGQKALDWLYLGRWVNKYQAVVGDRRQIYKPCKVEKTNYFYHIQMIRMVPNGRN